MSYGQRRGLPPHLAPIRRPHGRRQSRRLRHDPALARLKLPNELILVTDALAGLGIPPGRHCLDDLEYLSDVTCGRLPDGTRRARSCRSKQALAKVMGPAGIEPAAAVQLCTLNAARVLGLEATHGRVEVGRKAGPVLVD